MGREGLLRHFAVFHAVYHTTNQYHCLWEILLNLKLDVCLGQNIRVRLATGGLGFVGVTCVAEKR